MRETGGRQSKNYKNQRNSKKHRGQDRRGRKGYVLQTVTFVVFSIAATVFLLSSVSRGKENKEGTFLTETKKQDETQKETVTKAVKNVLIDNISISGLSKDEAREKLLELYSWNIKLSYGELTESLANPLPEIIDEILDKIYQSPEGGEYETDFGDIEENIKNQVAKIASKWNKNPVNAQLTGKGENNSWIYSEGKEGVQIKEEQAVEKIMSMASEKNFNGIIPVEITKEAPPLTASQVKKEYKVIGTFTTTATSNQNRNNNINLAINALDGLVILPGEEFSFNKTTGNRTIERGYKPAGAYRNGEFVEEPGGGVCQVSSTLYNALIFAGIKTTERHPHSFEPSYVIPGEDAMVSYDGYSGPDLKFVNTEKTSVAVRAVFQDKKITISMIGMPILEEGVTMSMRSEKTKEYDPPEPGYVEDQTLQTGQEVEVTKAVKGSTWKTYLITSKDGKVVKEDYFHTSTYRGKAGVVKRNTSGVVIPAETPAAEKETTEQKKQNQVPETNPAESQPAQTEPVKKPETQLPEVQVPETVTPETEESRTGAIGPGMS